MHLKPTDRPQNAADLVAAFRDLADRLASMGDYPLPNLWVSINIQPGGDEDAQIAAVDQLGAALFDQPGQNKTMSGGSVHHDVSGHVAGMAFSAYCGVENPEVKALRAELAALRAQQQPAMAMAPRSGHCPKHGTWTGPDGCPGCGQVAGRHA